MRRLLAILALVFGAGPLAAEKLSLAEISGYLNTLQSSQSPFTQINADGTISTGQFAIKRPGRARFDYNPPEQALVIVGSGAVAIFDGRTNSPPEQYPIGQTPLKLILQRNVNLQASGIVVDHSYDGTATKVVAQDPENPEFGTIEMVFTGSPVELRQWVIRDSSGSPTTLILGGLETQARLPDVLFSISHEISERGN